MQKLTDKQVKKLQKYAKAINTQVEDLQSKELYNELIERLPFIEDYHIDYHSKADQVKDTTELGDILLKGLQDLAAIVVEEGFGIKDYDTSKEERDDVMQFLEMMDEEFPSFIEIKVANKISKKLQKLKEEDKTDTIYYKKLKILNTTISKIRKIAKTSYEVKNLLTQLEWTFSQIILAVGMTKMPGTPSYSKVVEYEKEAKELCEKILAEAKDYDKAVKALQRVKV